MKNKKGKSLCFFSAKGGVGKTINILNLAGILEQLEKKVLIIDFDLYSGGIATYLDVKNDKSIFNVAFDVMNGDYKDIEEYVAKADEYIDVLCAPKDPRDASKIDIKCIEYIINNSKLNYDVVLIDTNHALNDINLTILENVDEITFLFNNDPIDLKNMKTLLSIFDNLKFNNYHVLLNNSRDPFKDYFSLYDIKKIIGHNIDYILSVNLFLKDIEKLVMKGNIVTLDKKFADMMSDDYHTFVVMATDLLGKDN